MVSISITESYISRKSVNPERSIDWITSKGESVKQWLINYCKRNKIEIRLEDIQTYGLDDKNIILTFKSEHQANCFLQNGNKHFPYFEFI